jgi:hypothetical protein
MVFNVRLTYIDVKVGLVQTPLTSNVSASRTKMVADCVKFTDLYMFAAVAVSACKR